MTLPHSAPTRPVDVVRGWAERYEATAEAWQLVEATSRSRDHALVPRWEARLADMRSTQQSLAAARRWRGGPRTLLAALDVQYRELPMTAGLAWLVRPDGHHGLGPAVLDSLLARLEIDGSGAESGVRIVLEEQRDRTRADLVVYGSAWTIVIEAKTFAVEQEQQLDRLYTHWSQEPSPRFVFLTRGQRLPTSADLSGDAWRGLTWHEVAAMARAAAEPITHVAPGVYEYIATLEAYHRA